LAQSGDLRQQCGLRCIAHAVGLARAADLGDECVNVAARSVDLGVALGQSCSQFGALRFLLR
jgi:hypothetical protein